MGTLPVLQHHFTGVRTVSPASELDRVKVGHLKMGMVDSAKVPSYSNISHFRSSRTRSFRGFSLKDLEYFT